MCVSFFFLLCMLNPERKGSFMRMVRICAGALALLLAMSTVGAALGETGARSLYRRAGEGNRGWWGVLYGDALLLARAEEGEDAQEDETEVVFVWPLWEWLLRFLGCL